VRAEDIWCGEEEEVAMDAPPVNTPILTGLLVVGVLLLIFIPGIFCLLHVQAPSSFEPVTKKRQ
jgi:hypothetical protein